MEDRIYGTHKIVFSPDRPLPQTGSAGPQGRRKV